MLKAWATAPDRQLTKEDFLIAQGVFRLSEEKSERICYPSDNRIRNRNVYMKNIGVDARARGWDCPTIDAAIQELCSFGSKVNNLKQHTGMDSETDNELHSLEQDAQGDHETGEVVDDLTQDDEMDVEPDDMVDLQYDDEVDDESDYNLKYHAEVSEEIGSQSTANN